MPGSGSGEHVSLGDRSPVLFSILYGWLRQAGVSNMAGWLGRFWYRFDTNVRRSVCGAMDQRTWMVLCGVSVVGHLDRMLIPLGTRGAIPVSSGASCWRRGVPCYVWFHNGLEHVCMVFLRNISRHLVVPLTQLLSPGVVWRQQQLIGVALALKLKR